MHSSALDYPYPPSLNDLSSTRQGLSYERPIQIPSSPDPLNQSTSVSPFSPYLYSAAYQDPTSFLSLRADASASTPSTSSIDTPVYDDFSAHPIIADGSGHHFLDGTSYPYSGQEAPQWMPSDMFHCLPFVPSSKPSSNGAISAHQAPSLAPLHLHPVMSKQAVSLLFRHVID
jgi:hypothetical protein